MIVRKTTTMMILGAAVFAAATAAAEDITCVAVYYPHWHKYPKGTEWFGEKWNQGEWDFVKTAVPRYPGHNVPVKPIPGYLNGKDPKDVETEIALASNAGIDVFLYDYYYYGGKTTQEEALEEGFLKATNRDRMKFALMWCYHERRDQFRPPVGQKDRRMLMELDHTPEEFLGLIDLSIKRYFGRPEYWRKDGKLFFSIFNAPYMVEKLGEDGVRRAIIAARGKVRSAGLGGIHFNAQGLEPNQLALAKSMGFDSLTDYNIPPSPTPSDLTTYESMAENSCRRWAAMRKGPLPYFPVVSTGWDRSARCPLKARPPWSENGYPFDMIVTNATPNKFEALLREAKTFVENDPKKFGVVYVNAWNEYTECPGLVPNNFDSDGFLRAVASVFGRKPANEYIYVNPSTKQMFTIPAATHENVAYGPHPKQKIDVFLPTGGRVSPRAAAAGDSRPPFPVVMYLHGGGWSQGAMEDHVLGSSIRMLLDRGIAVVGTGYRYICETRADMVKPPVMGCLDDCENALRFVKAHAAEWNLDMTRIGLAGGSAGACTALYLALKDDNVHGIRAVAPIIAQTSMDPKEMREWIPNIKYGAHAFGYSSFDAWLAHRADCLAVIERISPAALLRKISPSSAPRFRFQYGAQLKPGELARDSTHSSAFGERFREIATKRGVPCDVGYGSRNCFGDALIWLADALVGESR